MARGRRSGPRPIDGIVAAMPRARIAAALLIAACALALPPAARGGEIQGRVVMTGTAPPPKALPVTIDQYVCGTEKPAGDLVLSAAREVQWVVVWLENPPPGAPSAPPASPAQMDQKECAFAPRVVVVPAPGTVEFLNSDRLLHNLHSAPKENGPFNRTQPKGRTIPITFEKPEILRIDCDLHSWMRGWVVVARHPFYAITNGQGRFTLDNLPPGQYTLRLWHERLGEASRAVKVDGAAATTVTIELPPR
jgi:plastocyanin